MYWICDAIYMITSERCLLLSMYAMPLFFSLDDFKPQSVDSTKPGQLRVTDDEVNVSLPVVSQVYLYIYTFSCMLISLWYRHVTVPVAPSVWE